MRMTTLRHRMIGAGLAAFQTTRLHRAMARWTRGRGAILAFHHVRPAVPRAFAPNRLLEITPDHLDAVLRHLTARGYDIVPLAAVRERLAADGSRPFVALTFDDGYRDNVVHALPVLEQHAAPFTVFATTGFADRTARLWWLELETAIARLPEVRVPVEGAAWSFRTATVAGKEHAFARLSRLFRALPNPEISRALDTLGCAPDAARDLVEEYCLSWDELVRLGAHPLASVGCHTLSHPNLARLASADLKRELTDSRARLERALGRPVPMLAYPYGSRIAAGEREFVAAAAAGFAAAVTTRPGVLHRADMAWPTALPRLSVNGLWPDTGTLDVLLSGAPFWLWDTISGQSSGRGHRDAPSSGSAA